MSWRKYKVGRWGLGGGGGIAELCSVRGVARACVLPTYLLTALARLTASRVSHSLLSTTLKLLTELEGLKLVTRCCPQP